MSGNVEGLLILLHDPNRIKRIASMNVGSPILIIAPAVTLKVRLIEGAIPLPVGTRRTLGPVIECLITDDGISVVGNTLWSIPIPCTK